MESIEARKIYLTLTVISIILIFTSSTFAWIDDFTVPSKDWEPVQGEWEVEDGRYVQTDKEFTTTSTLETYHRSFVGDVNWSNYTVEVDLRIDEPGETAPIAGVFVRVTEKSEDGNYYFFRIDTRPDWGPGAVEAPNNNFSGENGGKMEGGLEPKFVALEENEVEYHLKVIAEENHFMYYVDDELILDVTDEVDPFLKGAVGLGTFNCGASFDNLEVTGDNIPGAVNQEGKLAVVWGTIKRSR